MATEQLVTADEPHCSSAGEERGGGGERTTLSPADAAPGKARGGVSPATQKKTSVQIIDPKDLKNYTIIKVEEKHGPLHNAIPCMPLALAIICCLLNIIAPGIGTLLSAPSVLCCATTRHDSRGKALCLNLVSAFLQALTCLLIVGWIWSILWGMTFVQLAWEKKTKKPAHWGPT